MDYSNRRYLIFPVDQLDKVDFSQVLETSKETVRKSVDGTKTFVKYQVTEVTSSYTESYTDPETGETIQNTVQEGVYGRPSIYSSEYPEYTHSEILDILSGEEWTSPIEEEI